MGNVAVRPDKHINAYAEKRCDTMMKRDVQHEKRACKWKTKDAVDGDLR